MKSVHLQLRRSGSMQLGNTHRKYFPNLIESNGNQIVFTMHRLISNQTDVLLVPNQLENGKYNLIWVWFNKISKIFLCVLLCSEFVREPGVSRHHGSKIKGLPETTRTSSQYGIEGFERGLQLIPHYAERHHTVTPLVFVNLKYRKEINFLFPSRLNFVSGRLKWGPNWGHCLDPSVPYSYLQPSYKYYINELVFCRINLD